MSKIKLTGSNSGYVELDSAADAGNLTLTLPTSGVRLLSNTDNVFSGITTTAELDINGKIDVSTDIVGGRNLKVTGITTLSDDLTLTGASYNVSWDKSDNQLEFGDNAKLSFGASSDLQIFHDGSNDHILSSGTGSLLIKGDAINLGSASGEYYVRAFENADVQIRYNNSTKIQTTNTGAVVTGILTATSFSGSGEGLTRTTQYSHRNVIINGDAKVSQRATTQGSITSGGYYAVDRWYVTMDTAGTWTMYQDADVPSGYGFSKSVSLDVNTANTSLSAGSRAMLSYRLEGQDVQRFCKGTANAKKYALSFWVKCGKTGTYVLELFDHDNSRHICKTYTISSANTWEQKKLIFDNETSNAFGNDNGKSLELQFYLAAGSNYTSGTLATSWASNTNANRAVGQVNVADSTSNKYFLTGVQMEEGQIATPFEHRSHHDELLRCYRYYNKKNPAYGRIGHMYTGSNIAFTMDLPCEMRASPTITNEGGLYFARQNGVALGLTGIGHGSTATTTARIALDVNSNGSAGNTAFIWAGNTFYILDAEL